MDPPEYRVVQKLMGSAFELIVAAETEPEAVHILETGIREIRRIEALLSEFRDSSEISKINSAAGTGPVTVPLEVFDLLSRCKKLHGITGGAFDITIGPLKRLYNFRKADFTFPTERVLAETLKLVGAEHLELTPGNAAYLPEKGMRISLAAIGKGYAADRVKKIWKEMGVSSGVINASGDLTVLGKKTNGSPWIAGIPDPDRKDRIICYVPLHNNAIATSGDSEQFFTRNGIRYSHTLNPKNGLPLSGIKSVSVVSSSGELSDALATAVYVMGTETGLNFIDQVPGTYCLVVDDKNVAWKSDNLEIFNQEIRK